MHGHENTYRLTKNCRRGGVYAIALKLLTVLIVFFLSGFLKLQAQINLTQSASTSCSNINVVFTATITPDPGTGAIDFYDGSIYIGSATLNAGKADFYKNNLSPGSHTITAKYLLIQSNTVTHTVNPTINPGTIDQSGGARCPDGNPGTINSLTPASGGNGGLVYTWQYSIDNGLTWNNTGITTESYNPDRITQTTQYRRMVYDGCGTMAYSGVTQYTVYPEAVSQTINASPTLIYTCSGTDGITCSGSVCAGVGVSATFSGGTTGIPGRTDYVDVYQMSINGAAWTNYTPGSVISTSNFSTAGTVSIRTRREPNYTNLGCNFGKYNIVTWTVNPIPALSSSLSAARTSSGSFVYDPQSSVSGTSFAWSRDAIAGISNTSASGTGSISETLVNTTHSPIDVTYHYVLNANGCSNTQDIVLSIAGANAFQYNVSSTGGVCEGSGTTIILSGSENGFSYQLKKDGLNVGSLIPGNGSTLNFPVQNAVGTYTVVASDGTDMIGSVTIYPLPNATIESQTNVNCFGGSTGAVNLTVTGGTSPYTYLWSNGATTADLTGLAAGTYTVTVTDSKGCTTTSSATITQPATALSASNTKTDVNCFGGSTGAVNLTVTGGTPAYTYLWSNGATTADLTGLAAGTYNVTITDSKGCTTTSSATITQPATALSASNTKTDVNCFGGSTGAVNLTVTGGTPAYTYLWSNGATTADLTGLAAGTYNVTITDSKGCTTTSSATITQPATALSASNTKTDVNCFGGSTGAVNLTVTGGTPAYTYLWSNGATTADLPGLAAGTYTVTVTDSKGCTTTSSATITQPATALSASNTKTDVNCFGGSTGAVNLTVTGGTPAYTYLWSNGATTADLTGLAAGTYNVTITDSKGCTTTSSATITQPATALSASNTKTDVNCFGGSTGAVNLTVTGGTPAYTYLWSNGATTADLTGLAAGTYNVTITDSKGCTTTSSATITQPATALTITSIGSNTPVCAGNTVDFNAAASGGTGTITYSWSGPGSFTANVQNPSRASITTTQGGTYNLTVTDANGCTANSSTDVTVNPTVTPTVFISPTPGNSICQGTAVTFTATPTNGGLNPSYQWQVNGNNVGTNSPTYSSSSFVNSDKVTVTMTSTATCPLPATVTSSIVTMTVNDLVTPSVSIAPSANNICPGTPVTFTTTTINGGTSPTYQWQVNGTPAGTNSPSFSSSTLNNNDVVSVTVTSNAACASLTTASSSVTMTVKPVPVPAVSIASSTNNICPGTSVTFTATPTNGGTTPTYQWQVNNVNAGTNSPTFTSTTLNNNDIVTVILTSNAACAAPTTATSTGITMVVNPGTPAKPGAITGSASVCPGTTGITYSITAVPNATNYTWTVPTGWNITAGQGSTSVTVTAGSTGQNGNISVTASNSCGTSTVNTLPVAVNSGIPAAPGTITGNGNQCINKSSLTYTIAAVPNATGYTWAVPTGWTISSGQGSTSITVATSGTAVSGNITVTANNTCGSSTVTSIPVSISTGIPATPGPILGAVSLCPPNNGLPYEISPVPGAISYNWTVPSGWTIASGAGTPEISVNVSASAAIGTNNVTVTAVNACGASSASVLAVTNGNSATADAGPDQVICAGQTATMNGTVGGAANPNRKADYIWSFTPSGSGSFNQTNDKNPIFTPSITSGTVTITLSTPKPTGNCAAASDQMIVTVRPLPTASINAATTSVCSGTGTTVTITATPNTTVVYKIGSGSNQTITVDGTGSAALTTGNLSSATTYSLVSVGYSSAPNCSQSASGSVTINVNAAPTVNAGGPDVVCQSATPTAITLSGASMTGATNAAWSITSGGGTLSNTAMTTNPSAVTYTPAANFSGTVTLTLTTEDPAGPCGPVSAIRTINVNAAPTVNAGGPDVVCQSATPTAITLSGASMTGATNAAWSITSGGGTLSNTAMTTNPSAVTYTPAANFSGTVTLTLTTEDPAGPCGPVSATRTINVNAAPTVNAGSAQTICSNGTVTMAATIGGSASTGTWSTSGSGSFSNNSPTAVYTPSAADINTGSVTLTYTTDDPAGPCGPVSANTILTIKKAVVITTQPSNTSVCAGLPADMSVVAIGDGLTYQWYKGTAPGGTAVSNSSNISGAQSANLHFNQAGLSDDGNYYVVISGALPCAPVTSAQRTLNVDQAINITTQPVSQTLCSGSNVSFNVVADANGDPLSYQWRKNGINIPGQTSATLTLNNISSADAGSYDVVITGPAGYTCSSTISSPATLAVNLPSTINLTSAAGTNAQTKCVNNALTTITYTIGGGGTGASITAGALPAGVTGTYSNGVFTISGTPTAAGSFNYTVTTTGPCSNVSATGTITVNDNSTLVLTSNNASQPVCANGSITPITYNVGGGATGVNVTGLPGGVTGTLNNGVFTMSGNPTVPGSYPFSVTTTGPCINPTLTGTITVNPNSTLTLTSSSADQRLCVNSVPTNITYALGGGATGATVTGLPPGMVGTYSGGIVTITNTPTTAGTYNYTVTTTGNCNNKTLGGTIIVDPAPAGGTLAPAITTICGTTNNGTIALTGQSGTIIRWESSTNGGGTWSPIANTASTFTYSNIAQTTIFRAVIQSGSCPLAFSTNAVVSMVPATTPTATVSPTEVCLGQPANLGANSNLPQTWADIDATFNQANPAGWRITQNGVKINFPANADNASTFPWSETNGPKTPFNGGVTYNNLQTTGKFAIASGQVNTTMETPVFSTIGMTSATLQFYQALVFAAGASGKIEISTDGGTTYNQTLIQYNGPLNIGNPANSWDPLNIDLSNFLGLSNLRIRFTYTGANNSNWAIDGLNLQPPGPVLTYNWTLTNPTGVPSPYYLNATNQQNVIATPPAPGTYTYQVATTIGGCPGGTANVVVTVRGLPVITPVNSCVGGGTVTFTQTGGASGGTWTRSGGGTINSGTGVFTPTTAGCFTVTYTTGGPGCADTKSFVVFPAAPVLTSANTCNTAFALPAVPTVNGFSVQYSINGGTWSATPTIPSTPGCYSIQARYVLATACGTNAVGTVSPGCISNTVNVVIFPLATAPVVTSGCGLFTVTPPPAVSGFDVQYSFDNGTTWGANTPPTADNCTGYQIKVRYVTNTVCGNIPAGTSAPTGCESPATTRKVDNTSPVVTGQAAVTSTTCKVQPPFVDPTATDNCGTTTIKSGYPLLGTLTTNGCTSTQTKTWIYVDACGNESLPFVQTATWSSDNTPPTVTGQATVTGTQCNVQPSFIDPTPADNCAGTITIKSGYPVLGTATPGANCTTSQTKTWIYVDACGNESLPFVQTATWNTDTEKPTVTGQATVTGTQCNVQPAFINPTPADNCGTPTLKANYPQDGAITAGANCTSSQTRTWIYVDACGNESAPFVQTATWKTDNIPPSLTCPTVPPVCEVANKTYTIPPLTVTDNCSASSALTITYVITGKTTRNGNGLDASGIFEVGVSTITWTVVDECGNTNSCSTQVTINPKPAPTIYHN